MSFALIIFGVIMILIAIVILHIGNKKAVPNTFLWAIFLMLKGIHEFAKFLEELQVSFIIKRFELFFAISSSFILLAIAIGFNGALSSPIGKLAAIIGITTVSFFIFTLPEDTLLEITYIIFDFGFLQSDPIKFFSGFFITILAILALLFTSIYLLWQSKKDLLTIYPNLIHTTIILIVLLSIYSIFEGFNFKNEIFITLKALSLFSFIIIPLFFILIKKVSLQKLLVIHEGGIPRLGYNFSSGLFLSFDRNNFLIAGFLAAITSFSKEILKGGITFSIRSNQLYFIITKINGNIYVLQSLHANKNLEKKFLEFGNRLNPKIQSVKLHNQIELNIVKPEIQESFSIFYYILEEG